MRLVFAGTPRPAIPSLLRIAGSQHSIEAVITRGDAPVGRRRVLTPSPVAEAASALDLPVIKADRLGEEATDAIAQIVPDLGVIVAYGGLVREPLLSLPRLGWINLHFSVLPRWRGAAPVQHTLIAGDNEIGAAVFQLVPELDAGAVFAQSRMPTPAATAGEVLDLLADSGAELLLGVINDLAAGNAVARPQTGEVTLAPKLTAADGLIDWGKDAATIVNLVRGVTPEPGAHTTVDGARLKVLLAGPGPTVDLAPGQVDVVDGAVIVGTASGTVMLERVQPAGKGAMDARDWRRGVRAEKVEVGS